MDDNLLFENPEAIDNAIVQMRKHGLVFETEDNLKDDLSCEIKLSSDKKKTTGIL